MEIEEVLSEGVDDLFSTVVGHSIDSVERFKDKYGDGGFILTLDDGRRFKFSGSADCCAYSDVKKISVHGKAVSNIITNVKRVKKNYDSEERWYFLADMNEIVSKDNKVMTVEVDTNEGSGYYSFGFEIKLDEEIK